MMTLGPSRMPNLCWKYCLKTNNCNPHRVKNFDFSQEIKRDLEKLRVKSTEFSGC